MSDNIKELVTVLRRAGYDKSADALEALAGEVVDLKKRLDIAQRWPTFSSAREAAEAAEAERDRLKEALLDIKHFGAGFAQDRARKALGDAS